MAFIIGFYIGCFVGECIMAFLIAGSDKDDDNIKKDDHKGE